MLYYEMPPYRPPSEAESLLLRFTRGCPWNHCAFCPAYRSIPFELRDKEELKKDILTARALHGPEVKRVFIGDSNSLVMKNDDLVEVLEFLTENFPHLERLTSYGRSKTILGKTPEDLKRLKAAGLTRIHVGLETGDDELLSFVKKGVTGSEHIEAGLKVKEAGITLSEYVILGLGGKERGRDHPYRTAEVLNAIVPDFIRTRTLLLVPGCELYDFMERGEFTPMEPEEILQETRILIDGLEGQSEYLSDHSSNYLSINGKIAEDKESMLKSLDTVLEAIALAPELKDQILQPEYLRRP